MTQTTFMMIDVHREVHRAVAHFHRSGAHGDDDACPLLSLPDEMLVEVVRRLAPREVLRMSRTCRRLGAVAYDYAVWRMLYVRDHGIPEADAALRRIREATDRRTTRATFARTQREASWWYQYERMFRRNEATAADQRAQWQHARMMVDPTPDRRAYFTRAPQLLDREAHPWTSPDYGFITLIDTRSEMFSHGTDHEGVRLYLQWRAEFHLFVLRWWYSTLTADECATAVELDAADPYHHRARGYVGRLSTLEARIREQRAFVYHVAPSVARWNEIGGDGRPDRDDATSTYVDRVRVVSNVNARGDFVVLVHHPTPTEALLPSLYFHERFERGSVRVMHARERFAVYWRERVWPPRRAYFTRMIDSMITAAVRSLGRTDDRHVRDDLSRVLVRYDRPPSSGGRNYVFTERFLNTYNSVSSLRERDARRIDAWLFQLWIAVVEQDDRINQWNRWVGVQSMHPFDVGVREIVPTLKWFNNMVRDWPEPRATNALLRKYIDLKQLLDTHKTVVSMRAQLRRQRRR